MAHTRAYRQILEQSRQHWRIGALAVVAVVVTIGAGLLLRSKPARLAPPPVRPAERIIVEVLNGTRRQGAARAATRLLRQQGMDVVFLGNADSLSDLTQVLVRRGDSGKAHYVLTALGEGRLRIETDTLRRVDVSVILGEDFHPRMELHP